MLINDLDNTCNITMNIEVNDKSKSINMKVFDKVSDEDNIEMYQIKRALQAKNAVYAVFEPLIINGSPLRFDSAVAKFSIGAVHKGKMYYWDRVNIKTIDLGSTFCYIVTSRQESKIINRRDNYRVLLNMKSSIIMDDNVDLAVIKDISVNGVGLYTRKKDKNDIGKKLDIIFQDGNETFKLNATVVRQDDNALKSGKLLGCKVNTSNKNMEKYIYEKQRKRMSAHKGNV